MESLSAFAIAACSMQTVSNRSWIRWRSFTALPVLALLLSLGCTVVRGYPRRSDDPKGEIEKLAQYLSPEAVATYDETTDPDDQRKWRNRVVNARLRAIDLHFHAFEKALYQEGVTSSVAADWTVLSLNTAAVLVPGSAQALAAISAGIIGGKAAFDKRAYFNKTMPALLASMIASRNAVLVEIRKSLRSGVETYPLQAALMDVDRYFSAGSIPGAIIEVTQNAGASSERSRAELNKLREFTFGDDLNSALIRQHWAPEGPDGKRVVDKDHEAAIKKWLSDHDLEDVKIPSFVNGSVFAAAREQMVKELGLGTK